MQRKKNMVDGQSSDDDDADDDDDDDDGDGVVEYDDWRVERRQ